MKTQTTSISIFDTAVKEIEEKHKDIFQDRNDTVFNHVSVMWADNFYYMEWKPYSDLSPKIRHEISKAFHSIQCS